MWISEKFADSAKGYLNEYFYENLEEKNKKQKNLFPCDLSAEPSLAQKAYKLDFNNLLMVFIKLGIF